MDSRKQQTSLFTFFKSRIETKIHNRRCAAEAPFQSVPDERKMTRNRLESKDCDAADLGKPSAPMEPGGKASDVEIEACPSSQKEELSHMIDRGNVTAGTALDAQENAGCSGLVEAAPRKGVVDDQGEEELRDSERVKGVSFPGNKRKRVEVQDPVEPPLTDLERHRAKNIRKNEEFLERLGIDCNRLAPRKGPPPLKPKLRCKKVAPLPTMRSLRSTRSSAQVPEPIAEPQVIGKHEEFIHYDDSTVRQYTCTMQHYRRTEEATSSSIDGFDPTGLSHCDPLLTRVYALDQSESSLGQLLAAGGHAGRLAVFGLRELAEGATSPGQEGTSNEPLLSWKGGGGWISAVQFLKQDAGTLLLTSSNDKRVVLWDLDKSSTTTGGPRIIAQTASLHSNGIFGMHELGGQVATASKDKTVAITRVTCAGLTPLTVLTGQHFSAVRSVHFRDAYHLADGSADRSVLISDLRLPEPGSICIEGAHETAVNVVYWHPTDEHLLLSASHDPSILLHDIRSPQQPLYRFSGHLGARSARSKSIYRPSFVVGGKYVASPGEGSQAISLYEVATGRTVSRGCLAFDATMTSAGKTGSHLWLAAEGGLVQRYQGTFGVVGSR